MERVAQRVFELESRVTRHRLGGAEREYRLVSEERELLMGSASGRQLARGASFSHPDGSIAFTLASTRRLVPTTWLAEGPGGTVARFVLALLGRGRTRVEDPRTGSVYGFAPDAGLASDVLRALVLAHTDLFTLGEGERMLAVVGRRGRARGAGGSAGTLTLVDPEWDPPLDLVAACLVYKHQVIDCVRSPD